MWQSRAWNLNSMGIIMKTLSLCSLTLLLMVSTTFPQPIPDTLWTGTYGGGNYDAAESIQQTQDGGYIIAGHTRSFSAESYDYYLVKIDSIGDILWYRTYGGSGIDKAYGVQQTTDRGFIVVGYTRSYGSGEANIYLVKTDLGGDTLWTRRWGGSCDDIGYDIQITNDGGYIIAGMANGAASVFLLKIDAMGSTLWEHYYNGYYLRSVQQTNDGGYVAAGWTIIGGDKDVYLIKTDSEGNTLWTRTYGLIASQECGYSVQETMDGGFIIVGYTGETSLHDFYLVKADSIGNCLWSRTYGGPDCDNAYSVRQTLDGGYIMVGESGG